MESKFRILKLGNMKKIKNIYKTLLILIIISACKDIDSLDFLESIPPPPPPVGVTPTVTATITPTNTITPTATSTPTESPTTTESPPTPVSDFNFTPVNPWPPAVNP